MRNFVCFVIFVGCVKFFNAEDISLGGLGCTKYYQSDNVSKVMEEIYQSLEITPVYSFEYNMTQLDILTSVSAEYLNQTALITITSDSKECYFNYTKQFQLNNSQLTIPELPGVQKLYPECDYNLNINVNGNCVTKHYKIMEPKSCQGFFDEDTLTVVPNNVLKYLNVSSYRDNAIRLNILFSPTDEYLDYSGFVVISSKDARCNHVEEYSIKLRERNITLPRHKFPDSHLESGCEYFIDLEIESPTEKFCIPTTYKIPDFCENKVPRAKLLNYEKQENGLYKITWDPGTTINNSSYLISDITYSFIKPPKGFDPYSVFVKNDLSSYVSILNLTDVPVNTPLKINAVFFTNEQCSNVDVLEITVLKDYQVIIHSMVILIAVFGIFVLVCVNNLQFCKFHMLKKVEVFMFGSHETQETVLLHVGTGKRSEVINLNYGNADQFEMLPTIIKLVKLVGEGRFGVVYLGEINNFKTKTCTKVAVKTVREYAPQEEVDALLEEISNLKKIALNGSHENVIKMVGCCKIIKPYKLVLEYVDGGDLKKYLVGLRDQWGNRKPFDSFLTENNYIRDSSTGLSGSYCPLPLSTETNSTMLSYESEKGCPYVQAKPLLEHTLLQNFAHQIAKGMSFLESISIVHRDLAARNVLIDENKTLKISDFGMSRIGDYFHKNNKMLPLRWMALESIETYSCTSKSDVWSFGVVLWEIGTLGAFPYQGIADEVLLSSLKQGTRLIRPEVCTDELYSIMLKCWAEDPNERPTFEQLEKHLNGEKSIYLDFKKLNPSYVFPPTIFPT